MWSRIKQKYFDMPLVWKLMTVFLLFLAVFFVISQIVLQICFSAYDEKLYEKSIQELDYFTQEVNRSLAEIEDLSATIAMDDAIQAQLMELHQSQSVDATYSLGVLNLRQLISSKTNTNRYIRSAAFYDGRQTDIMLGVKVQDVPDEIKRELRDSLLHARGACVRRDPGADWPFYIVGRNVLEKKNARLTYLGTLLLNWSAEEVIGRNVRNLDAEHASLYVYTDQWTVYQDAEPEGFRLPECREGQGYEIIRVGIRRYFMCYLYSSATGWMYANVFPYTDIYGQIQKIRTVQLAVILLLAAAFTLGMMRVITSITRPLGRLTQTMKIVETGDFAGARQDLPQHPHNDETGQLQKEFATMLEKIDELIKENYEKQLLLKDTNYRMLRAQINPHFIYNTLNTINWMVKWKQNDEVSKLIVEFGRLLRSSFSGEPFATVEEEVELTEGYMSIQRYRYQSRADFVVEKSGDLKKYRTPRMILQPLVENAIYYGIEDSLEKCTVRVTVQEEESSIFYQVSDTGPGMDAATLGAVRDGTVRSKGNGIGLANIRERLRLLFEDSEFTIESTPGEGTVVRIRMPKCEVEEHVQAADRG